MITLLSIFLFLFTLSPDDANAHLDILVCDNTRTTAQFHIPVPQLCVKRPPERIDECKVQLFDPRPQARAYPLWGCAFSTVRWSTVNYFFGAQTHEISEPVYQPAPLNRCHSALRTWNDDFLGKIVNVGGNVFSTLNKVNLVFTWPTGSSGVVRNLVLVNTSFVFDQANRHMYSSISPLRGCVVSAGACKDDKYTFLWKYTSRFLCPRGTKNQTKVGLDSAVLHLQSDDTISRIEIPGMGLSFHSAVPCSPFVKACFAGKRLFCLPNGYFLTIMRCNTTAMQEFFKSSTNASLVFSRHLDRLKRSKDLPTRDLNQMLTGSATLNYALDITADYMSKLTSQINFLDCNIERSLTISLKLIARSYPSEVLSLLLNKTVGATSSGDTLSLFPCVKRSVRLRSSLKLSDTFAFRPLVEDKIGDMTVIYQIYPDGNAYKQIVFKEKYKMNQDVTFFIKGVPHRYQNYTLQPNLHHKIAPITPSLDPISLHFPDVDFEELFESRPNFDAGGLNYYNLLALVQDNRVNVETMRKFWEELDYDDSSRPHIGLNSLTSQNLASVLAGIKSPLLFSVLLFLNALAGLWGVLLTVVLVRYILIRCCMLGEANMRVN